MKHSSATVRINLYQGQLQNDLHSFSSFPLPGNLKRLNNILTYLQFIRAVVISNPQFSRFSVFDFDILHCLWR